MAVTCSEVRRLAPQSTHSSERMWSIRSPSWMQSTGHSSTQVLSLTPMHSPVITYVMGGCPSWGPGARGLTSDGPASCYPPMRDISTFGVTFLRLVWRVRSSE